METFSIPGPPTEAPTSEKAAPDVVNHPPHYCVGGLECFEVMKQVFGIEAVKVFCRLNAFKYLFRSETKNGDQDIAKATWYLTRYLELCVDKEDEMK